MATGDIIGVVNGQVQYFKTMAEFNAAGAQSATAEQIPKSASCTGTGSVYGTVNGQVQRFDSPESMVLAGAQSTPIEDIKAARLAEPTASQPSREPGILYPQYGGRTVRGNSSEGKDFTPMAYDYTETVEMRSKEGEMVPIPKSIHEAYFAGPGNKYYQSAESFIRGKLDVYRTTGDQTATGNKQDVKTGLWSRSPTNKPVVAPADLPAPFKSSLEKGGTETGGAKVPTKRVSAINPETGMVEYLYVPEGSYMQQELKNVKVGVSESGEIGIYEGLGRNEAGEQRMTVNPDTGKLESMMLIGGGSRAAAQSGMFTFAAASPAVYGRGRVQEGREGLTLAKRQAPGAVAYGMTGGEVYDIVQGGMGGAYDINTKISKLGAEAYGGVVAPIDNRLLGDIRYEDVSNRAAWNLAAYVDPMAVNKGKAALPGANIPWSVGEKTPAVFFMDKDTKSGEGAPAVTLRDFDAVVNVPEGKAVGYAVVNGQVDWGSSGSKNELSGVPSPFKSVSLPAESDRLIGGWEMAGTTTTRPMELGDLPMPFKSVSASAEEQPKSSTIFEQPKGDLFGIAIPGLSFFMQGKEIATTSKTKKLPETTVFDRRETKEVEGGTQYTDYYKTTGGAVVTESTTEKETPSGFDALMTGLNKDIGGVLSATLQSPKKATQSGYSLFHVAPGKEEEFKKSAPLTSASIKFFTEGQYAGFIEKPATAALSYAEGYIGGKIFGGIMKGWGAARAAGAPAIIAKGGLSRGLEQGSEFIMKKAIPGALALTYGASVASRSTSGFTDYNPESVAIKSGKLASTEVLPGLYGFQKGVESKSIVGSVVKAAKTSNQGYQEALLAGKGEPQPLRVSVDANEPPTVGEYLKNRNWNLDATSKLDLGAKATYAAPPETSRLGATGGGAPEPTTTGRFDWYIRQPVTRVASRPIDLVKQDYRAFLQEHTIESKVTLGTKDRFIEVPNGMTRISHVTTATPDIIAGVESRGLQFSGKMKGGKYTRGETIEDTSVDLMGKGVYFQSAPSGYKGKWFEAARETYVGEMADRGIYKGYEQFGNDILLFDIKPELHLVNPSLSLVEKMPVASGLSRRDVYALRESMTDYETPMFTGKGSYVGKLTRAELINPTETTVIGKRVPTTFDYVINKFGAGKFAKTTQPEPSTINIRQKYSPTELGLQPVSTEYGAEIIRPAYGKQNIIGQTISKKLGIGRTPVAEFNAAGATSATAEQIPKSASRTGTGSVYGTVNGQVGWGAGGFAEGGERPKGSKVVAGEATTTTTGIPDPFLSPSRPAEKTSPDLIKSGLMGAITLGGLNPLGGVLIGAWEALSRGKSNEIPFATELKGLGGKYGEPTKAFLKSAPVFESVYRGGYAFEAKNQYERKSVEVSKEVEPLISAYEKRITGYNTDLTRYETDLTGYNTRLDAYNKSKTEAGYNALVAEEATIIAEKATLDQQKTALDQQKATIDAKILPVTELEKRYQLAAADMTGNVNQKGLLTYGAGSWFGDIGKGYSDVVVKPIEGVTKGWGAVGQFAVGLAGTPRMVMDIGQMSLVGGETIVRSAKDAPGLAVSGLAMQGKGIKEQAETNPAGLAGQLVGMYLLGSAVNAVGTRGIGVARSVGKKYVPIENIGYDAKYGYPIKPVKATAGDLIRSFEEGKLYPAPARMSAGKTATSPGIQPPYLHGEGGVPVARLPNAQKGGLISETVVDAPRGSITTIRLGQGEPLPQYIEAALPKTMQFKFMTTTPEPRIVLIEGGNPVSMATYRISPSGDVLYISEMESFTKGAGRQTILEFNRMASSKGIDIIMAKPIPGVEGFYTKTGFIPSVKGSGFYTRGVTSKTITVTSRGDITLWTAHESPSIMPMFTKVGQAYKLAGEGSSEISGISAAPVLEGYFAKVGGQIPKDIGFDLPFKRPTAFHTTIADLETIPASVKAQLPRNAQGKITDYSLVTEYMQNRLADVPGGQAFVPMLKGEYEANIATNSVFEVTGNNYYTKLGGFGKSHFLGTKVPIVEQNLIGFIPKGVESNIPTGGTGSSYRKPPAINLFYSGPSLVSVTTPGSALPPSVRSPTGTSHGLPRITPSRIEGSRPSPTESGYRASSSSRKTISGPVSLSSRRPSSTTSLVSESSVIPTYKSIISPTTKPSTPPASSKMTTPLSPSRNIYKPSTPVSPRTSTTTSPTTSPRPPRYPYSGSGTTPPVTPPITPVPPGLPGGFNLGGGGGSGVLPQASRKYTELMGFYHAKRGVSDKAIDPFTKKKYAKKKIRGVK